MAPPPPAAPTFADDRAAFDSLGRPVALSGIERGLQELFLEDGEEGGGAVEPGERFAGVARASLINLALYTENPGRVAAEAETLAAVAGETACRSLLVVADPSAPEQGAEAWIQVHCQIDRNGRRTVCTEQISFLLRGGSPGLLRNVVFANLDSDLPLAFWWRGNLSEAFEDRLHSRIDRLLFDSEEWDSPRDQFVRLEAARSASATPFAMHDLAFSRLNALRHAVANAFDRPALARRIDALESVAIRHQPGYRMSALYLAAWLAARLGAPADSGRRSGGDLVFLRRSGGGPSSLAVRLEEAGEGGGAGVEIDLQLGDWRVEVSRCRVRDYLRTVIRRPGGEAEEDWLPRGRMNDAALVADILNRAGRNRTHAALVPHLRHLLAL